MQVENRKQLIKKLSELFENIQQESPAGNGQQAFYQSLVEVIESHYFQTHPPRIKKYTIVITDLRGFTVMAEKYPILSVIELLNYYFDLMSKIIVKYSGVVDKFIGDSIMALFEIGDDDEDSVLNALTCAIVMQVAMKEVNKVASSLGMENMYMGIGINSGEVVAAQMGSDNYRESTVIGDEVNLAARRSFFSAGPDTD